MRGMRGVAVALLLFLVSGAARAEGDDGRLVAVMDGPLMTEVYRIRASGIEKVGRQKVVGVGEFGWTDSATLWVLDKDQDKLTVHQLVNGAPARTIDVPMSAWELAPAPDALLVDLRITEMWGVRRDEPRTVWSIYFDSAMAGTIRAGSLRAAPLPDS